MSEQNSMVNHPSNYQSETGLEAIDVIEAFTFDLQGIEAFDTGNVLKYMCRWKSKNGLQDLEKAKWYLEHLIAHVAKLEEENKPIMDADPLEGIEIVFDSRIDAERVLSAMKDVVDTYGAATVADYKKLSNLPFNDIDHDYGWTNLENTQVIRMRDGNYALALSHSTPII